MFNISFREEGVKISQLERGRGERKKKKRKVTNQETGSILEYTGGGNG